MNSPDESIHHRLAIYAKLDLSRTGLRQFEQSATGDPVNDFLALVASANSQRGIQLDAIRNALEDDVYAKLTQLGVAVVEREHVQEMLVEQNMAGWNKANQVGNSNPFGQLLYATHVLYLEIGDASVPEKVRFSVRLNDAYSGEVLWANTSERLIYASSTTQQHILSTGKVVLLNPQKNSSRKIHHPLHMPLLEAHKDPQLTRLVCLEGSRDNSMLELRDLFEQTTTTFSQGMIDSDKIVPIKNVDVIPWEHRPRYMVWQICNGLLPPAGRVIACSERQATIALNRANSLTSRGDLLSAFRPQPNIYDPSIPVRLRQLPAQLTITEVSSNSLESSWADPRVKVLWAEGAPLKVGDVVMRPNPPVPIVMVAEPVVQRPDRDIWKKLKLDNRFRLEKYSRMTKENAPRLARLLRQSLLEMRINCVEAVSTSSSRSRGFGKRSLSSQATHIIRTTISPDVGNTYDVHLTVVATKRKEPVVEFTVKLSDQQLANWKP